MRDWRRQREHSKHADSSGWWNLFKVVIVCIVVVVGVYAVSIVAAAAAEDKHGGICHDWSNLSDLSPMTDTHAAYLFANSFFNPVFRMRP